MCTSDAVVFNVTLPSDFRAPEIYGYRAHDTSATFPRYDDREVKWIPREKIANEFWQSTKKQVTTLFVLLLPSALSNVFARMSGKIDFFFSSLLYFFFSSKVFRRCIPSDLTNADPKFQDFLAGHSVVLVLHSTLSTRFSSLFVKIVLTNKPDQYEPIHTVTSLGTWSGVGGW
jgi:hypothetical protein